MPGKLLDLAESHALPEAQLSAREQTPRIDADVPRIGWVLFRCQVNPIQRTLAQLGVTGGKKGVTADRDDDKVPSSQTEAAPRGKVPLFSTAGPIHRAHGEFSL